MKIGPKQNHEDKKYHHTLDIRYQNPIKFTGHLQEDEKVLSLQIETTPSTSYQIYRTSVIGIVKLVTGPKNNQEENIFMIGF